MEEQKNILTFDDALESDTIDFKTEDYFKPDFNLNVSNQMTMEEAVKNQGINDRIISDIKNNLKPDTSVLESIGAGVSSAARAIKNTIPDALDSLTIMSKNVDWFYPNMTEEERDNMALEIALTRKANKSFEAMESHYNGTDNWITMGSAAIAQFLGQMSLNALVPGLGSVQMGVQTATDTALNYAVDVMEKEGYNMRKAGNWKDNTITLANGAVQAFIEHKLGAERIVNGAFSRAMTGTLRAGATTAFSEGVEEFTQEWAGYFFNTLAGHEDRTVGQVLSDALTGAVVGALIGGTAGATAYKTKTSDIAKVLREKFGYEPKLANAMAQDMVDNAMYKSKEEMTIQAQFKYHYGENYNNFVNKVKTLLKEAGWERRNPGKDLNAFAQLNADTLISPFINMANMSNMPAKDFFDVANMEVIGNQVVLNTQRFDNPNEVRRRIKEVEAQIKEENLKQGIDNRARKQQLQSQKKTLQTILNKLKFEEMFDKEAINNQLAKIQQEDVENKMPEVASSLKGIVEDWDFNHKGMYVGKHRIPVNMLVVDLKDINISHIEGEANPNYKNKQLQNRVRADKKDDVRLQQKSNNLQPESLVFGNDTTTGAPVVNMEGDIIAGNGRGEILRRAYVNQEQVPGLKERIEAYKNLLRQQGYDIEGMEMPILIRQIDVPVEQQVAIASVSNIPTMSAFQHSQRAKNDAKVIADKNLTDPMAFLSSLTPDEKVEFELEKGNIDQLALDRRFNDAVMALILNDNKLFESLILGNKLPKKIISGITNAVKTSNLLERLKTDTGMREDIRNALISAPKTNSDNLAMNIQQATVGEDNPFNKNSLLLLFTEGNSLQISEGLNNILGRIEQYEDLISKDSLLKDQTPIYSQEDLMKQTLKDIALTKEYFTDKGQIRTDFQDGSKQQKLSQNLLALFTSEAPSQSGSVEQQVMSEEDNLLFQSDRQEYTQDTINIDGVEKPALNSEGNYLGRTEEEIRNFYKWFGDSKVVDEEGKPLVMYHGTREFKFGKELPSFDTFDRNKLRSGQNAVGFYFSENKDFAKNFGTRIMPVYLKIDNPQIYNNGEPTVKELVLEQKEVDNAKSDNTKYLAYKILQDTKKYTDSYDKFVMDIYHKSNLIPYQNRRDGNYNDAVNLGIEKSKEIANNYVNILKSENKDGVIIQNTIIDSNSNKGNRNTQFVVFDSNQIKSVDNRGTYNSDTGNIYYQSAFAGSRVDYDRPSLEAIGSGEGNQAHGYGLYYALNKDVAESYRETFTNENKQVPYTVLGDKTLVEYIKENGKQKAKEVIQNKINESEMKIKTYEEVGDNFTAQIWQGHLNELQTLLKAVDTEGKGQVHEVDIPENPYLLDEQKKFSEQSPFVQAKLKDIANDFDGLNGNTKVQDFLNKENPTGKKIYEFIAQSGSDISMNEFGIGMYEGADKSASKLLEKYGIKGITYFGSQDGRCFVIFNPDDVQVVNKFYQKETSSKPSSRYNGFFDADLKTILLGENMNEGTLQHEIAHFFLDRCFEIWQNGTGTEQFNERFQQIADMLNIRREQTTLTTSQQEQWARMTEAYLFGKGTPAGRMPLMNQFLQWVPAQYEAIENLQYLGADGKYHNPVLTDQAMNLFDALYQNGIVATSPAIDFKPIEDKEHNIIVADTETQKERVKTLNDGAVKGEGQQLNLSEMAQDKSLYENRKTRLWEEVVAEKEETTPAEKPTFIQRVLAGRGTNTQAEMKQNAIDWIKKNPKHAERLVEGTSLEDIDNGLFMNDSGIEATTLFLTYAEQNKDTLSPETYRDIILKAEVYRSLAGKAGGLTNYHKSLYLDAYKYIIGQRTQKLALARYGNVENAVNLLDADLTKTAEKWATRISQTESNSEQRKQVVSEMVKEMEQEFGQTLDGNIFYQEDIEKLIKMAKSDTPYIKNKAKSIAKKLAKLEIPEAERTQLLNLADNAQKAIDSGSLNSNNKEVLEKACGDIKAYQDFLGKETINPTKYQSMVQELMPRLMLSSPSTHITNIFSNTIEGAILSGTLKYQYRKYGNVVDSNKIEQARKHIADVYDLTGINLAQISDLKDTSLVGGEYKMLTPDNQAKGLQKIDPMRFLAKEDNFFRNKQFVDTLAYIASEDAKGDSKKANELFEEYLKIGNKSEDAIKARHQAVLCGELATFTQNGAFARAMTTIRKALDTVSFGKNSKGLGTFLMPFVKTPSNIIQMGAEAIASPFTVGYKMFKGKELNFSDRLAVGNLISSAILFGLASAVGAVYEPKKNKYDYKGDSLVFGGVRFKMSNFGVIAAPLRQILLISNAITGKGKWTQDTLNTGISTLPGFDTLDDLTQLRDKPIEFFNNTLGNATQRLVPSILRYPIRYATKNEPKTNNKWLKPYARAIGLAKTSQKIDKGAEVFLRMAFGYNIDWK